MHPRLSVKVEVKSKVDAVPIYVKPADLLLRVPICDKGTQVVPTPAAIVKEFPRVLQDILVMFVLPNARVSHVHEYAGS